MGPEAQPREKKSKPGVSLRLPSKITAVSWKDVAETLGPILLVSAIAILVALVQIRSLAIIHAGLGALAFCTVVVLTMLAAQTFDERLLWDNHSDG